MRVKDTPSFYSASWPHSFVISHHHRSSTLFFLSKLQISHHSVFWIIVQLYSVNLIHHLSPLSYHPSLSLSSIPDLKHTCSTNPSTIDPFLPGQTAHWISTRLPTRTLYRSAFCFSFFCYFLLVDACVGLNWRSASFWSHGNKTLIYSYIHVRIVLLVWIVN